MNLQDPPIRSEYDFYIPPLLHTRHVFILQNSRNISSIIDGYLLIYLDKKKLRDLLKSYLISFDT